MGIKEGKQEGTKDHLNKVTGNRNIFSFLFSPREY